MASKMEMNTAEVIARVEVLQKKIDSGMHAFVVKEATDFQSFARSNAPWQDHTGNARQGLFAKGISENGKHAIVTYHTMLYGIWLEVKNSGEYEILDTTIRVMGQRAMSDLNYFLDRV